MSKWANGIYTPKNPEKYVGNHKPRYRSSWEMTFMLFLDNNKHITQWASEPMRIPYKHPFTGKQTVYVPDFLVVYENKYGKRIAELIEIKPRKQSLIESKAANTKDRMVVAINHTKWAAAQAYCKRAGLVFRVITENDIFRTSQGR